MLGTEQKVSWVRHTAGDVSVMTHWLGHSGSSTRTVSLDTIKMNFSDGGLAMLQTVLFLFYFPSVLEMSQKVFCPIPRLTLSCLQPLHLAAKSLIKY